MKTKLRKSIAIGCIGATVLTLVPATSWAAVADEPLCTSMITPYMLYIASSEAKIFSSGTTLTAYSKVIGNIGTTRSRIEAEIQVKNGSHWRTATTLSSVEGGSIATLSQTYTGVTGETYRVKAKVTVWAGTNSETQTIYSGESTL